MKETYVRFWYYNVMKEGRVIARNYRTVRVVLADNTDIQIPIYSVVHEEQR